MAMLLVATSAQAGSPAPVAETPNLDAVLQSASSAYTLVELAAGCGWLSGAEAIGKARGGALAFAMSGLPVPTKAQVLARLFADDEKLLVAATARAQERIRGGACKQAEARVRWNGFAKYLADADAANAQAAAARTAEREARAAESAPAVKH